MLALPCRSAVLQGEGMPIHGRPFDKGNLYIHFSGWIGLRVGQTLFANVGSLMAGCANLTLLAFSQPVALPIRCLPASMLTGAFLMSFYVRCSGVP